MKGKKTTSKKGTRVTKSKKKQNKGLLNYLRDNHRIVALASIIAFAGVGAWIIVSSKAAILSTSVNNFDKVEVGTLYQKLWASGENTATGWTGSTEGGRCLAGNISQQAVYAQLNAVNYIRRVNNLEPVRAAVLDGPNQANAQKTALMMRAQESLSHYPTSSWKCYTAAGAATAAKSNLALSYPSLKPIRAIELYMDDPGSSNTGVGHRRWIMNPDAKAFSFGMTDNSSAMQVVGLDESTANNDPPYTMWPAKGWNPVNLEPNGRWSLSTSYGKNVAYAKIVVRKGSASGTVVPITKYATHSGYGRPTVVWQMPSEFNKTETTYFVTVSGIKNSDGGSIAPFTYSVSFFTPST